MIVADASALIASLLREPGWEMMDRFINECSISTVNYAEVATRCLDLGQAPQPLLKELRGLGLHVIEFDQGMAERAASLRPATRHLGLSLGDRACLALALRLEAPVLTTDRAWAKLDLGLDIRLIR